MFFFVFFSGDPNFIKQLVNFDKDNISDRVLKKIGTYVVQSDFQPDIVGRVSLAAKSLCMWVRAMELYGRIFRVVEPKRQRLHAAEATLNEKQAQLQEAMDKLAEVSRHSLTIAFCPALYLTLCLSQATVVFAMTKHRVTYSKLAQQCVN